MDLEISIEALLNKRRIESDRIEFKARWNPDDIYHSVCALANDFDNVGGGYIVIGVEEKNGIAIRPVKGVAEWEIDQIQALAAWAGPKNTACQASSPLPQTNFPYLKGQALGWMPLQFATGLLFGQV